MKYKLIFFLLLCCGFSQAGVAEGMQIDIGYSAKDIPMSGTFDFLAVSPFHTPGLLGGVFWSLPTNISALDDLYAVNFIVTIRPEQFIAFSLCPRIGSRIRIANWSFIEASAGGFISLHFSLNTGLSSGLPEELNYKQKGGFDWGVIGSFAAGLSFGQNNNWEIYLQLDNFLSFPIGYGNFFQQSIIGARFYP